MSDISFFVQRLGVNLCWVQCSCVNQKQQRRPSLKANAVNQVVKGSDGQEQALYTLLAATGMRISEALALEAKHFTNRGRTIEVRQQVDRDNPRIVAYLKTDAACRDIDLHPDVAEYLQAFISGKDGLLFKTQEWHATFAQQHRGTLAYRTAQSNAA